ncbi:MAG: hypothetical protein VKK80_17365 [Prochlorothrix sp.]|nr:hypothetical protein [Prochlorothrix sp.]
MTRLALVVGIDTYQALPPLSIARTSATALAQRLERYGNCTVQQLPAPVATDHPGVSVENPVHLASLKENLLELFQPSRGMYAKTVIFYFAGYAVLKNGGLQEGFLVTSDGQSGQEPHGLSFFWLQRLLRDSPVEQWAVWLDCWQVAEPVRATVETIGRSTTPVLTDPDPRQDSMGPSRLGWHQEVRSSTTALAPLLNLREADPGEKQGYDRLFLGTCQPAAIVEKQTLGSAAASLGVPSAVAQGAAAIGGDSPGLVSLSGAPLSPLSQAIVEGLDPDRTESGIITSTFLHNWVSTALSDRLPNHHWRQSGHPVVLSRALRDFCPYKGLAYFDCNTEDPQYFHGREALTAQLLENIQHRNFLAVLGPSGSGKSSVLRAGLMHQLQLGQQIPDSDRWQVHILQPGGHPLLNLAFAFLDLNLPLVERAKQLGEIESLVSQGSEGMRRLVQASAAPRLILVVDQFEELFTLCRDKAERHLFLDCLLGAMNASAEGRYAVPLQVVIGMRSDFFSACTKADYAALGAAIQSNHVMVPPLMQTELQDAICKPAHQLGVTLEPELVQQMIADVAGASNVLPLLEYTLTELWYQRRDRRLSLVDYIRLGGIRGTLEKRADALYQQLDPEQQAALQHIFLSLTQFGDGVTEDSRRRVFKQDLATPQFPTLVIDSLVQRLANEKLVVTSAWAPPGTGLGEEQVVDVIHEALIRHWGLLRRWIDTHREDLRQQRELQDLAEQWFRKGQSPDYLLQGEALGEALAFWLQWTTTAVEPRSQLFHRPFSGLVQGFLDASQEEQRQRTAASQAQEQQFQQQRRQTQRIRQQLRTLALGAGGALLGAVLLLAAQRQALEGQAIEQLTTEIRQALADNQDLEAQRLSLEARQRWRSALLTRWLQPHLEASITAGLQQALYQSAEFNQIRSVGGGIVSLALNPQVFGEEPEESAAPRSTLLPSVQSPLLATSDREGRVQLWTAQGQSVGELGENRSQEQVYEVAWSPNGLKLATAGRDGTVHLWTETGQALAVLDSQGQQRDRSAATIATPLQLFDVAWSPDSTELVGTGEAGRVYRWREDGTPLAEFAAHTGWIYDVVYSPSGNRIATAGGDGLVRIWDLEGKLQGELGDQGSTVWSVAFSPDGQTLATASSDHQVRLWDRQGQLRATLQGHQDRVLRVVFSPDGQTLASSSTDGTIRLWDLQGTPLQTFQGHGDWVYDLAYSPQGDFLVSGGRDGTTRFWRLQAPAQQHYLAHPDRILQTASDPQGELIATSSTDGQVGLWTPQGQWVTMLQGHQGWVLDVAFSATGDRLITGGSDGTVRLWSRSGQLLQTLQTGQGWIYQVAFSPDGRFWASRGRDGTVQLWATEGQLLAQLPTQGAKAESGATEDTDLNLSAIYSFLFSPDSQFLATRSQDNGVRLWTLPQVGATDTDALEMTLLRDHQGEIYDVAFTPDSRFVATAGSDGTVRLWDRQGNPRSVLRSNSAEIYSISISQDGETLATGSSDGSTRLWTLEGREIATLPTAAEPVWEVLLSPDGQTLATRSNSHTARLWSVPEGKNLVELPAHAAPVWNLHFSADSQSLLTHSGDGLVQRWDLKGQRLALLQDPQGQVTHLALAPQGQRLASGGSDGRVRLWDAAGAQVAELEGHGGAVRQVQFEGRGETLASLSADGTVRLWQKDGKFLRELGQQGDTPLYGLAWAKSGQDLLTSDAAGMVRRWSVQGENRGEFKAGVGEVLALAWSDDRQQIATGHGDGTVQLWTEQGELLGTRSGHQDRITSLVFDQDGNLASSSEDGTVRLWDRQGTLLGELRGHQGPVTQVQFNPRSPHNQPQLLTSGQDGTIRLWNSQGEALAVIPAHWGGVGTAIFEASGQGVISGGWRDGQIRTWTLGDESVLAQSLCQQLGAYLQSPMMADRSGLCP